jgi:hypothetical protein
MPAHRNEVRSSHDRKRDSTLLIHWDGGTAPMASRSIGMDCKASGLFSRASLPVAFTRAPTGLGPTYATAPSLSIDGRHRHPPPKQFSRRYRRSIADGQPQPDQNQRQPENEPARTVARWTLSTKKKLNAVASGHAFAGNIDRRATPSEASCWVGGAPMNPSACDPSYSPRAESDDRG